MPIVDAYGACKYQQIMDKTWGHLRAKRGTRHSGHMTFVHSLEGSTVLIEFEFPTLDDSPWLNQDTEDFFEPFETVAKRGTIFRFVGEYVVYKNGRRKFVGKTTKLRLRPPERRLT